MADVPPAPGAASETTEPDSRPDGQRGRGPLLLRRHFPLESETAYFVLANALDVIVTVALLYLNQDGPGLRHREANPVAGFFLDHWGLRGLAYFKLGIVTFVIVVTQLIARENVRTARWLLYGLTAVVGAVVVYSLFLLLRAV